MIKRRNRPATAIAARERHKDSASSTPVPEGAGESNGTAKRGDSEAPERKEGGEEESARGTGDEEGDEEEDENRRNLDISEIIGLRKLRKSRQGIDSTKLVVGDVKKKRKKKKKEGPNGEPEEDEDEEGDGDTQKGGSGGLTSFGLRASMAAATEGEEADKDGMARRVVRTNNFTQQTNKLDVDKHMMAYIEENLKVRSRPKEETEEEKQARERQQDPNDVLYHLDLEKWNANKDQQTNKKREEGSVTNSMSMLTAIPEVDLGMDARLRNIEDTEKAKREIAEHRHDRKRPNPDEEHLVASRFYRPNIKQRSDADIMRDAKLEAMGMQPHDNRHHHNHHNHNGNNSNNNSNNNNNNGNNSNSNNNNHHNNNNNNGNSNANRQHSGNHHHHHQQRPQMATDELVMERFKKRMRR